MQAGNLSLLGKARFAPFFWVQLLGAFNDNLLKFATLYLANFVIYKDNPENGEALAAISTGLFVIPFFLFSAFSGQLADIFDKARIIRWVKMIEIVIMVIALIGFFAKSLPILLLCLFLMGVHSALFGPVKYSILLQHLPEDEIVGATGLVEGGTFLAILGGQLFAGIVPYWLAGFSLAAFAVIGLGLSLAIPPAPSLEPNAKIEWNIFKSTKDVVMVAAKTRGIWLSILGISWFFAAGAVLVSEFVPLVSTNLKASQEVATLFLIVFSIMIAAGSFSVNSLLKGEISAKYVPISALGLAIGMLDMWGSTQGFAARIQGATIWQFLATAGRGALFLTLRLFHFAVGSISFRFTQSYKSTAMMRSVHASSPPIIL